MIKDVIKNKYLFYLNKIQHKHSYCNIWYVYNDESNINVSVHFLECNCGNRKTIFQNKKRIKEHVLEIIKLWKNNLITIETLNEAIK